MWLGKTLGKETITFSTLFLLGLQKIKEVSFKQVNFFENLVLQFLSLERPVFDLGTFFAVLQTQNDTGICEARNGMLRLCFSRNNLINLLVLHRSENNLS